MARYISEEAHSSKELGFRESQFAHHRCNDGGGAVSIDWRSLYCARSDAICRWRNNIDFVWLAFNTTVTTQPACSELVAMFSIYYLPCWPIPNELLLRVVKQMYRDGRQERPSLRTSLVCLLLQIDLTSRIQH